jgi:hypothetical protein
MHVARATLSGVARLPLRTRVHQMKLSSLKVDIVREEEGDWIDIPDLPGVSLKVRSTNSKGYSMALSLRSQKFARKYGSRPIPPEESLKANGSLLAEHILLDWKGLTEDDGTTEIPFNKELAAEYLQNPEYRQLANAVVWAAQRVADTDDVEIESKTKNSAAPSATTSSDGALTASSAT